MAFKMLVANRGEIAIRILRSASELHWKTVAIYCAEDPSHATFADEAVLLDSFEAFMNPDLIARIAVHCTHVHPGYGFLSETPALPLALQSIPSPRPITFIGPSVDALRIASDKLLSRNLASSLGVPIAPGSSVSSPNDVLAFAEASDGGVEYPVMIKALDGGGGRGIRIVNGPEEVEEAFRRCLGESPSKRIFVEKALTGPGWKHIEVQIVGDGTGAVTHLWERECSIQRRFQKIIEVAPSSLPRPLIQPLLDASLKMASHLHYRGLGTFEFLLKTNAHTNTPEREEYPWVFLEINPRVQVEHTVTEEITSIDLIRTQLLLFAPSFPTLTSLSLSSPPPPPSTYALQLRLTAEDPLKNFALSPGFIPSSSSSSSPSSSPSSRASTITWPSGPGIRIDTWLTTHPRFLPPSPGTTQHTFKYRVTTDLDSLLAKLVIRGSKTWDEMCRRAQRSLQELSLGGGVKTNVQVLAGVVAHPDWRTEGGTRVDTLWLERNLGDVLEIGRGVLGGSRGGVGMDELRQVVQGQEEGRGGVKVAPNEVGGVGGGTVLLQPGSLFHLTLSPSPSSSSSSPTPPTSSSAPPTPSAASRHTLTLASIRENAFPYTLTGTLQSSFHLPGTSSPLIDFELVQSTSGLGSGGGGGEFEFGDLNNENHVCSPMTGKIVDLHPALQNHPSKPKPNLPVKKGETIVVLSVMKMESVLVAPRDCVIERVGKGVKVGMVVGEGVLVCVIGDVDVDGGGGGKEKSRL